MNTSTSFSRAVKRASPNGFGLALAGFGLNGPGQKNPGLNGRENYEPNPNPIGLNGPKRIKSQTSQNTNFIQKFNDKMHKLFKLNIY